MYYAIVINTCSLFVIFLFSAFHVVLADPAPLALFKGIEKERMKYEPIQIKFTTRYIDEQGFGTLTLSSYAEVAGDSQRLEVFAADNPKIFPGVVSVLANGEVNHFRRNKFGGVRCYGLDEAVRRADPIYDPRILGLVDNPLANKTVRIALCYDVYNKHSLIGREKINGTDVWHVHCVQRDSATADFWIEEPLFRVHKSLVESAHLKVLVECKYDSESVGPFPSEFTIERFEDNKQVFNRTVHIDEIVYGKPIPPERFTLASMDLPLNTDVVDYRISRRLGYWDGEKLVDDPVSVSAQELRELMQPKRGWFNYLLMGIGGILVFGALLRILIKRLSGKGN